MIRPTRVLVVEDQSDQRDVLGDVLTEAGYAVTLAREGAEGLAAARAERPDVVLLDLMMPQMDGASLLQAMRDDPALATVKVVVVTGVHTQHVSRLLRPDATLFKPFGVRELLSTLESLKLAPRVDG